MPNAQNKFVKDKDDLWCTPNCTRPDYVSDDTEWNMRHFALGKVFLDNWTFQAPADHGWHSVEEAGVSPLCWHSFSNETAIEAKRLRLSEIRLKASYLAVEFDALSSKWKRDTRHLSLISKQISHPAYLRIIGMGEGAIPLILKELRDRPAHWFAALRATANTDPTGNDDSPSEAREAWLRWGTSEGYID
jgi:hypothetical protein